MRCKRFYVESFTRNSVLIVEIHEDVAIIGLVNKTLQRTI